MERRPLYLMHNRRLWVDFSEPALAVSGSERAMQFFPLSRVSRVIANESVTWSTEALLACAKFGVPVTFVGSGGETVGVLFGQRPSGADLGEQLEELLDHPDAAVLYETWQAAMDREMLKELQRARLVRHGARGREALLRLRREAVSDFPQPDIDGARAILTSWTRAFASEVLMATGLDPERLRLVMTRVPLLDDLALWLAVDLEVPLRRECERRRRRSQRREHGYRASVPGDWELARLFHGRVPRLRRIARRVLQRLTNRILLL